MSRSGAQARVDVVTLVAMTVAAFLWFSVAIDTAATMVARAAQIEAPIARAVGASAAAPSALAPSCAVSGDLVGNGDPAEVYAVLCR